jgi:hypothetical protein
MAYLRARREALGGYLPARAAAPPLAVPPLESARPASRSRPTARRCRPRWRWCACWGTCCATARSGPRIVPIVADEARTFGMADLFRQIGIYSPVGQLYEPEDAGSMLYYREARRPAARGGHHRGRRALVLGRGRHVLQRPRRADAAVLHLLLDVRLPARRRPDLGRRRPACPRLPDRRDRRAHHARRRGPAASGRVEPRRRGHGAELPRLRPGLRLRARGDPRPRRARDAERGGRLLLRHGDERELRAAVAARGGSAGVIRGMYRYAGTSARMRAGCGCSAPGRSCAR